MFSAFVEPTDWIVEISPQRREEIWHHSRTLPTTWGRWNAYQNQLCLDTCLNWLKDEHLSAATAGISAANAPALWEIVNGSIVKVGNVRIALIPTEAIDLRELEVPQEWVDIPSWAADYYLGVQITPDNQTVRIYGYTTHQILKTQGTYDPQDRTYCVDTDDLITDLNALWLSYSRYTTSQTRASIATLPALDSTQADRLIERLGNREIILPRLAVPFPTWAALLENPQWQHRLYQQLQTRSNSAPVVTQLGRWFQGQIDALWQTLDLVLSPQQLASPIRSGSNATQANNTNDITRAKVYDLGDGQIALIIKISPLQGGESRIEIQVEPAGGATHLPGETQLRLLTMENAEIVQTRASMTQMITASLRLSAGERFQIEIACEGKQLTEVFEL